MRKRNFCSISKFTISASIIAIKTYVDILTEELEDTEDLEEYQK